jgi:NAD(P)-dependent dehydrogenase (short-subunit alcohol dehydrogenase family)
MTDLSGTTAVVTGASRGIGAATAELLRQAGARVAGLARSLAPREEADRWDVPCDVTDGPALDRACGQVLERWGAPDVVVNNAGLFLLRPFEDTDAEAFSHQLGANLQAPFNVARAFLPAMRQAGRGLLVTVGSVSDHMGLPENAAYAASKYGLRGLHEVLSAEYHGSGVRFSLVSPGATDTGMWDPVDPDTRPGFMARSDMLRPEDVAEAIVFVISRPANMQVDWLRLGPVSSST